MVLYRASEQFQCDAGVRSECAYAAHFHVHYASACIYERTQYSPVCMLCTLQMASHHPHNMYLGIMQVNWD